MSEAGNVWAYVIGAYSVAWVTLVAYSIRLAVMTRRARQAMLDLGGEE